VGRLDRLGLQDAAGCHTAEDLRALLVSGAYKDIEVVEVADVHVWHDWTAHSWDPQKNELVADQMGVKYATQAGYHPGGLLGFLMVLELVEDPNKKHSLFGYQHPPTPYRIEQLRPLVDELRQQPDLITGKAQYHKLRPYLTE
jgi:hypothetical protein